MSHGLFGGKSKLLVFCLLRGKKARERNPYVKCVSSGTMFNLMIYLFIHLVIIQHYLFSGYFVPGNVQSIGAMIVQF